MKKLRDVLRSADSDTIWDIANNTPAADKGTEKRIFASAMSRIETSAQDEDELQTSYTAPIRRCSRFRGTALTAACIAVIAAVTGSLVFLNGKSPDTGKNKPVVIEDTTRSPYVTENTTVTVTTVTDTSSIAYTSSPTTTAITTQPASYASTQTTNVSTTAADIVTSPETTALPVATSAVTETTSPVTTTEDNELTDEEMKQLAMRKLEEMEKEKGGCMLRAAAVLHGMLPEDEPRVSLEEVLKELEENEDDRFAPLRAESFNTLPDFIDANTFSRIIGLLSSDDDIKVKKQFRPVIDLYMDRPEYSPENYDSECKTVRFEYWIDDNGMEQIVLSSNDSLQALNVYYIKYDHSGNILVEDLLKAVTFRQPSES